MGPITNRITDQIKSVMSNLVCFVNETRSIVAIPHRVYLFIFKSKTEVSIQFVLAPVSSQQQSNRCFSIWNMPNIKAPAIQIPLLKADRIHE